MPKILKRALIFIEVHKMPRYLLIYYKYLWLAYLLQSKNVLFSLSLSSAGESPVHGGLLGMLNPAQLSIPYSINIIEFGLIMYSVQGVPIKSARSLR